MKNIKKIVATVLVVLAIVSCFAVTASAGTTLAKGEISKSESVAYVGNVDAKQCKYSGSNDSSSTKSLQFATQYLYIVWISDTSIVRAPGKSFSNELTGSSSVEHKWRVKLSPADSSTSGCKGTTIIEKYK